jgi:hypothetical protein
MEKKLVRNSFFLCITETDLSIYNKSTLLTFFPSVLKSKYKRRNIEFIHQQLLDYYSDFENIVIHSNELNFDKITKKQINFRLKGFNKTVKHKTKFEMMTILIECFLNITSIRKILCNIVNYLLSFRNSININDLKNTTKNNIINKIRVLKWFDERFQISKTKSELINIVSKCKSDIKNTQTLYLDDVKNIPVNNSIIINDYKYDINELSEYIISSKGVNINPYDNTKYLWINEIEKEHIIDRISKINKDIIDIFKQNSNVRIKLLEDINKYPDILKHIGETGFICYNDNISNYNNNTTDEKLFSQSQIYILKLREYIDKNDIFNVLPAQFSLTSILNETDTCIHLTGNRLMILYLYCIELAKTELNDITSVANDNYNYIQISKDKYITFSINVETKDIHILCIIPSLFYTILLGKYYYMNDFYHIDKLAVEDNTLESYYSVIIDKVVQLYPGLYK